MAAVDLGAALVSKDPDEKLRALRAFAADGLAALPAADAERVCDCLGDGDALVRGAAANALVASADTAAPFAEKVARLLVSGDAGAKCAAAEVLGALSAAAGAHAAALAALLDDAREDQSCAAVAACCSAGRPKAALRFPKVAAAEALPKLGSQGRAFAEAVAKLLGDGVAEVRCAAAASLGAMGAEGAAHEEAVLALLRAERDPRVIASAAVSLAEMGKAKDGVSKASTDVISKLFTSQHPGVRAAAARAVGCMGDEAQPHVAKLLKCLEDRSPQVKIAAIGAIVSLGELGQVYACDLGRLAHDEWQLPAVRAAAVEALPHMGERGMALADDIGELLGDPFDEVRSAAMRALDSMGSQAEYYPW